jgi:cytochrome c peroxidase
MQGMLIALILILAGVVTSCVDHAGTPSDATVSDYPVPDGFPPIPTPLDNPITSEKIELGRLLFYDARLSRSGDLSCSSCHRQANAFADSVAVSRGNNNERGLRNAPAIINVAYSGTWFWDGRARTLEEQVAAALTSPIEMASDTVLVSARLSSDDHYRRLFASVFGSAPSAHNAIKALATFCRVLISGNSRYDRFRRGEVAALSDAEQRGMSLFFSERTGCAHCHSGINFTDNSFHSIGIHTHYYDRGRYYVTGSEGDIGKFKTPTLRNIALSAPYMNDGTLATLEDVLEHYNSGGKPFVNKDPRIRPLGLTKQELDDLRAFLHALTDSTFITTKAFAPP